MKLLNLSNQQIIKRLCRRCGLDRIVCDHALCEECDSYECFAYAPAIKLPERVK